MTTVVSFFLGSFTAQTGSSLLRQGLHCFSLKISSKVWVNSDVHCTCRAESQTTSLFSRFQSEHSCGAKSWLCTYPSGPALTGQAECLLSRALGRSQGRSVGHKHRLHRIKSPRYLFSLTGQPSKQAHRVGNRKQAECSCYLEVLGGPIGTF